MASTQAHYHEFSFRRKWKKYETLHNILTHRHRPTLMPILGKRWKSVASKCFHPYSSTLAGQKIKEKRAATGREVTLSQQNPLLCFPLWSDLQLRLPIFDLVLRSPWKLDHHPCCHTKFSGKNKKIEDRTRTRQCSGTLRMLLAQIWPLMTTAGTPIPQKSKEVNGSQELKGLADPINGWVFSEKSGRSRKTLVFFP